MKADHTPGLVLACLGLLGISCLVILCSLVLVTVLESVNIKTRHEGRKRKGTKLNNNCGGVV